MITLAFFMPAIVYIGDAVGTQTETVLIRNLAYGINFRIHRFVVREIGAACLIGVSLSIFIGLITHFIWRDVVLTGVLSISFFLQLLFLHVLR